MKQNISVEALRSEIESRYHAALKALEVLAAYIDECQPSVPEKVIEIGHIVNIQADGQVANTDLNVHELSLRDLGLRPGSFREKVILKLNDEWMTVHEIALASGVSDKNARGVLYATAAPGMGIESRNTERGAEFRRVE